MAESSSRQRGRHGDGTIYTTADGRLRAAVTVPHALTGEPVRRYLSAKTDAEIKRKLKDARAERATGRTPTVATWAERWLGLVAHRVRPATLAVYRIALHRHVIPTLGRVELARLRPSDVEGMTSGMIGAGSAASTAALARRVLVVCLTDAARDGLIVRNVAQLARAPRTAEPFRRALSADEARAFLAAVASDPLGSFVALGLATGLRRGELLALRWSDVDEAAGTLTVSRALARSAAGGYAVAEPKSRRARRTIALPALARDALRRQAEAQAREREAAGTAWQDRDGLIFTDPVGRLWHPESVTSAWAALVKRTGIGRLRLHDLRHTAATLSLSGGVPVQDVSDMLGHSSPSITMDIYSHSVDEGPRRVADAMDRALGGAS
ncbi:MAG: tyrosine-type recombinase/integrase [Chloroflexi bacterium]|nr:tyrosine-type recombinase/integrase [Chloroflexota bacterium]